MGKWYTLGLEKGFQLITKSFTEVSWYQTEKRFKRMRNNTSHIERKINFWFFMGIVLSDLVFCCRSAWAHVVVKIHHVILFASAVKIRKDRSRREKERACKFHHWKHNLVYAYPKLPCYFWKILRVYRPKGHYHPRTEELKVDNCIHCLWPWRNPLFSWLEFWTRNEW